MKPTAVPEDVHYRGGLPQTARPTLSVGGNALYISIKATEWVFEHSKSQVSSRLVLLAIAASVNTDGYAWPGLEAIEHRSNLSRPTVLRALEELESLGEIIVERGGEGPKDTNCYYFSAFMERVKKGKDFDDKGKEEAPKRVNPSLHEEEVLEKEELEEVPSALKFPKPEKQKKDRTWKRREYARPPSDHHATTPRQEYKSAALQRQERIDQYFADYRKDHGLEGPRPGEDVFSFGERLIAEGKSKS